MFHDRIDAGLALAQKLLHYKNVDGVALAVPRGGVPIAFPVAQILNLPLEIIMSKKLGHPFNPEYAIGSVSLSGISVTSHEDVSPEYIESETQKIRARLKEMYRMYMGDKEPSDIKNKIVIVIDDGVATGNTMLGTIDMLREGSPKKIVIAVPVASSSAARKLSAAADEFISVLIPGDFRAVGQYYENFEQVSDEEVMDILNQLRIHLAKAG